MSWPAEIDVFLAVGELALYVAYLDGWPGKQRIWPWATALTGLAVSVAGNIGHIQARSGQPVIVADRLTAAISPVAASAGLAIGLLVLKMTRQGSGSGAAETTAGPALTLAGRSYPAAAADGRPARRSNPVPSASSSRARSSSPATGSAILGVVYAHMSDRAGFGGGADAQLHGQCLIEFHLGLQQVFTSSPRLQH